MKSMVHQIARWISSLGHPILTIPAFAIWFEFTHEPPEKACLVSGLIVGLVVLPLSLKTWLGYKKGAYSNMDVSNREERKRWFRAPIIMMLLLTAALYFGFHDLPLTIAVGAITVMLFAFKLVNQYAIKASLHVGVNAYLALVALSMSNLLFGIISAITLVVGWSRVVLKRHTLAEVLVGALIGAFFGAIAAHFMGF